MLTSDAIGAQALAREPQLQTLQLSASTALSVSSERNSIKGKINTLSGRLLSKDVLSLAGATGVVALRASGESISGDRALLTGVVTLPASRLFSMERLSLNKSGQVNLFGLMAGVNSMRLPVTPMTVGLTAHVAVQAEANLGSMKSGLPLRAVAAQLVRGSFGTYIGTAAISARLASFISSLTNFATTSQGFNVRIFGHRGTRQLRQHNPNQYTEVIDQVITQPYDWMQVIQTKGFNPVGTILVGPQFGFTDFATCVVIEVPDTKQIRYEFNPPNRVPVLAGPNSPILSGRHTFEWLPGTTISIVEGP